MPRLAAICGYLLAFLVLSALTWALWQWRFVAAADAPALTLDYLPQGVAREIRGPVVETDGKFSMTAGSQAPAVEYRWIHPPARRHALISFQASCRGVRLGKMPWEDARVILLWVDAEGKMVSNHLPLWSGRGDQPFVKKEMIVSFARGGTVPRLLLDNLGSEGEFVVDGFEVQSVELRPWAGWATAGLVAAWIAWIAIGIRRWVAPESVSTVRVTAAALLCSGFAWVYCLPGPWLFCPPLCTPYPIKAVPPPPPKPVPPPPPSIVPSIPGPGPVVAVAPDTASNQAATPVVPAPPVAVPPAIAKEQAPEISGPPEAMNGALTRWIFNNLFYLKRALHFLAFAGLSCLMATFAGSWRAMWPAAALGGISEFSQWALGFGFDGSDVMDLAVDFTAALVGLVIWRWLIKWWSKRRQPAASNT